MLKTALEVLNKIEDSGFQAYIVGGFARDKYLLIESPDIDICTSATPKELLKIFNKANLKNENYGSLTVFYKNIRFEITTFRKELKYKEARKPIEIEYIQDLEEDLKRRDFTMNTLCIDKDDRLIDKFNALVDIKDELIRTVGDPDFKFQEDALRILRAIRFVSQLNFTLEEKTEQAFYNNKNLIELLTNHRKKQELEKIFLGKNPTKAINKIIDLELQEHLGINGLENATIVQEASAMWAQLDIDVQDWPFTKNERENIKNIKNLLTKKEIDDYTLYKYGLYVCSVVYKIKQLDYKALSKKHSELPIKSKKDINIKPIEIANIIEEKPSKKISKIFEDIEKQIVNKKITNSNKKIEQYIIKKYKKAHLK